MLNEGNGYFSPHFDHSIQQICLVETETAIELDGERDVHIGIRDIDIREVCVLKLDLHLMFGNLREIDAKQREQVGELQMVDDAEAIEFVDAWRGFGVLDLREPSVGNTEFLISFHLRNCQAFLGDFSCCDS